MKIGKPAETQQPDPLSRSASGAVRAVPGHARSDAVEKTAPVDAVRLSRTSRSLAAEGESMPVRTKKVEDVQAALRDGRFQIDAHAVADRMIAQAAELLETLSRAK